MSTMSRWFFFAVLINAFSMSQRNGVALAAAATATTSSYQIVTISDLHFNPFYDPSLYPDLTAAEPGQWASIFARSKVTTPAAGGTDTNYPLFLLTLASIKQNLGSSPVVLCTGDLLGHYIPKLFYTAYYKRADYPTPDAAAVAAMEKFVDKTFAFVAGEIRAAVGDVPVIYAPGNIDTYGPGLGPDSTFLTNNAETVYSQLLNSISEHQTFLNAFTQDGYYSVQLLGSKLLVVVLNSNSFVGIAPSITDADAELTWLDSQLSAAKSAGQKVWILMHVPPGANAQLIAQTAAVPSDVDEDTASMMWDEKVQEGFLQTLGRYPGRVTLMLAGHTHMDEFRILSTGDVLEQLPGISPCFGNNPAYKVLTIGQDTFAPTDYEAFDYNLATFPAQFGVLYRFSATYGYGAESALAASLQNLYPRLNTDQKDQDTYTLLYDSGSTAVNPVTYFPWNPINDVNWPIFSCTIGKMGEPDYVDCVNSY